MILVMAGAAVAFFIKNCYALVRHSPAKSSLIFENCVYGLIFITLIKPAIEVCPLWFFHMYLIWKNQTTYDYVKSIQEPYQNSTSLRSQKTESKPSRWGCQKRTSRDSIRPVQLNNHSLQEVDGGVINSNTTDSNSSEGEII